MKHRRIRFEYNVGSKKDEKVEEDLLKMDSVNPMNIKLVEVGDRMEVLLRVAKKTGRRLIVDGSGRPQSRKTAMLLHKDARIIARGCKQISERTKVNRILTAGARRDGHAAAKYVLWVAYELWGFERCDGVFHLVPSAMKRGNRAASALHRKQVAGLVDWIENRGRIWTLSGDGNMNLDKDREARRIKGPLNRVANIYSAATFRNRWIDFTACSKSLHMNVAALDGFSSDHRPLCTEEI